MAGKRRSGEVIEVDKKVLLSMLRKIEDLERKLGEIEARFAQKEL